MNVIPTTFMEVRDRGAELLAEYAAECRISELGEPDPQWEMYEVLQASGKLHVFGAYESDELIGFATVLLSVLPHYGVMAGIVESLFVGREYRKTCAGLALLSAVETCAGLAGCKAMLCSAPTGGKLEAVLNADGKFTRTNAVFCKSLG